MNLFERHEVIACDCDEVLSELTRNAIALTNGKVGDTLIQYDDITDYYIYNLFEHITQQQAFDFFHAPMDTDKKSLQLPVVDNSRKGIENITSSGRKVHVVTARGLDYENYTNDWLDKNYAGNIVDSHFASHFNSHYRNKSDICHEIGAGIIIEDNIDYALECAHNGVEAILLEKPWNIHRKDTHALLHRVKDWNELLNDE